MTRNQPRFPDGAPVDQADVCRIARSRIETRGRADADLHESRRRFP
ncbi:MULTISPECIES: hypothetical protein [Nocardia]|nr:hypothetical protein [Nocardia abscessus]MBF6474906.1 hypothetical protein [Nocardia abscessus]